MTDYPLYQVGDVRDPSEDDVRYGDEGDACADACARGGNTVWGVWRWNGEVPTLLALVFEGTVYRA